MNGLLDIAAYAYQDMHVWRGGGGGAPNPPQPHLHMLFYWGPPRRQEFCRQSTHLSTYEPPRRQG